VLSIYPAHECIFHLHPLRNAHFCLRALNQKRSTATVALIEARAVGDINEAGFDAHGLSGT
jgi:hypothetical protein